MRLLATALMVLALAVPSFAATPVFTNVGPRHAGGPELAPDLVFPCVVTCRDGDINENEPDCYDGYYDYTNGGCNTTGWTELCPQGSDGTSHACGTSGTYYYGYYSYRDTDWFSAVAGYDGYVTETVTAEFDPFVILIYASSGVISCSNYTYVYTFGVACAASSASATVPQGSTFWPWVGTQVFGYGVPCGSRYDLDVTNTTCGTTATEPTTWGRVKGLFR